MFWDILDNVKNDYHLLFRHRLALPTIIYFLSRSVGLIWISFLTLIKENSKSLGSWLRHCNGHIFQSAPWLSDRHSSRINSYHFFFLATPFIPCTVYKTISVSFFISNLAFTPFLAYLRVCAVWDWNRFIVGWFGVSWLAVATSGFTGLHALKGIQVGDYCTEIIVGKSVLAPFVTTFFNHTFVFLAITYGICRNTLGRDLSFRNCIQLMVGKDLSTFSKALLHDSQVSYLWVLLSPQIPESRSLTNLT